MVIVSKSNEKIKYINSLKDKKYREKYNKYILEGIKIVDEYISLKGQNPFEFIVLSREMLFRTNGGKELFEKLQNFENVIEVDDKVFEYLSDTETPQGVLLVAPIKDITCAMLIDNINKGGKVVVLDKIADSGNIGTIIRTAISFGINNIICTKGTASVYSPKVIRSTMGAIYKVNVFYATTEDMQVIKKELNNNGYILCGTDLKATKYLNEISSSEKMVYVLGNEANGVSDEIKNVCDEYVKIPMESTQESLNVAIAAAILMYNSYIGGNN